MLDEICHELTKMKKNFAVKLSKKDIDEKDRIVATKLLNNLIGELRENVIDSGVESADKYYFYKVKLVLRGSKFAIDNKQRVQSIAGVVKGNKDGLFDPKKILQNLNLPEAQARVVVDDFRVISEAQHKLLRKRLTQSRKNLN